MGRQIHFDLVRDVLDNQLIDVNGVPFGKVDGVLLELRSGAQPRLAFLEVGGVTALHRLPRLIRRLLEPIARRFGAQRGEPLLIPFINIEQIARDIHVDIDATATPALHWQRRAHRIVSRIPQPRP